jgi:hypothetical protein
MTAMLANIPYLNHNTTIRVLFEQHSRTSLHFQEWFYLCSPLGWYIVAMSDVDDEFKHLFISLLIWLHRITARLTLCVRFAMYNTFSSRSFEKSATLFTDLESQIANILAEFEQKLPVCCNTINMHILHHLPNTIRNWGPTSAVWTMAVERYTQTYHRCLIHVTSGD